jgi:hypothetical protein
VDKYEFRQRSTIAVILKIDYLRVLVQYLDPAKEMVMSVMSYETWINESKGESHWYGDDTRNKYLLLVDAAVKDHQTNPSLSAQNVIYLRLKDWIDDHVKRKGQWEQSVFNRRGAIKTLVDQVTPKPPPQTLQTLPEGPSIPARKPDAPPKLPFKNEMEAKSRQFSIKYDDSGQQAAIADISFKLNSVATDIVKIQGSVAQSLLQIQLVFKSAIAAGFKHFADIHKQDAEDVEFKISCVKMVFEAIAEEAPWPVNRVGYWVAKAADIAHVETYGPEHGKGLLLEISLPSEYAIIRGVANIKETIKEATTVNVAPGKLPNEGQVVNIFEKRMISFSEQLRTALDDATKSITDDPARQRYMAGFKKSVDKVRGEATRKLVQNTNLEIEQLRIRVCNEQKGMFSAIVKSGRRPDLTTDELGRWVCLQFVCDYIFTGLLKLGPGETIIGRKTTEISDFKLGDPFIDYLVQLGLATKGKSFEGVEKSTAHIFGKGMIPWDGRASDKLALVMYLHYARNKLNPFRIISSTLDRVDGETRPVTIAMFKEMSRLMIVQIGIYVLKQREPGLFRNRLKSDVMLTEYELIPE